MTLKRSLVFLIPLLLMAAVLLMTAGTLSGEESDETATVAAGLAGKATTDMSSLVLRVGMTLGIILILIMAGVYVMRLVGGRTGLQPSSRMKVLDRCFLAPKRALYTVRLGERIVVVGVTDTNISAVTEFSPDEGETLYPAGLGEKNDSIPFGDSLKSFMNRFSQRDA